MENAAIPVICRWRSSSATRPQKAFGTASTSRVRRTASTRSCTLSSSNSFRRQWRAPSALRPSPVAISLSAVYRSATALSSHARSVPIVASVNRGGIMRQSGGVKVHQDLGGSLSA